MKIIFNLICKNESHCILRSLESVKDFVDGFCIYDTGSTDETCDIIQKFLDKIGKPYLFNKGEFKNFSYARNKVLEDSKTLGEIVYWHDADEYLNLSYEDKIELKNKIIQLFENGATSIDSEIVFPNMKYNRKSFFLANNFKWEGVIHEYLKPLIKEQKNYKVGSITKVTSEGFSHKNPNKYQEYGEILEKDWLQNKNTRSLFYAANSYKDFSNTQSGPVQEYYRKKAITLYLERAKINLGFSEEQYVSLLYAADSMKDDLKLKTLFFCEELNTNRIEHLFKIACEFYDLSCYKTAFHYSKKAMNKLLNNKITYQLFLNHHIYNWQLFDLHMVISSQLKNLKEYNIASLFLKDAIQNGVNIPDKDFNRIKQNLS